MSENKNKGIIYNLVCGKIKQYELLFVALILGVLLLNIMEAKIVEVVSIIVLSGIAMIYIMTAYEDLSNTGFTEKDVLFQKTNGFGSAIALIGILFSLVDFPGHKNMLLVGSISLLISIIYIFAKNRIDFFGKKMVLRMIIIAAIAVVMFFEGLM